MPAKSKSQQRLFAMVHAYNKGEFHGSRSLRKRVADLSKHISDEDAKHFAQTPHTGLPERKSTKAAQVVIQPETVQRVYDKIPVGAYAAAVAPRSHRRRSLLRRALSGAMFGAAIGGAGAGALGYAVARHAARTSGASGASGASVPNPITPPEAATRCGLWGASRGALAGSITGLGAGILDNIRG